MYQLMKHQKISENILLTYNPKRTRCVYSGERIDEHEIALTISPSKSGSNNVWIKIANIQDFLAGLEGIYNTTELNAKVYTNNQVWSRDFQERLDGSVGFIWSVTIKDVQTEETCAYCNGDLDRQSAVSFNGNKGKTCIPFIHVRCIPEVVHKARKQLNDNKGEITAQLL